MPIGNDRQQEMAKLYENMCYRYSRYEVWQDMVYMVATAISNTVDKRHFDQREANYLRIAQKYGKEELNVFPEFFRHIVTGMEENPDCDFLGELYMKLELGNSHAGQFFTPYHVCRMMADVTIDGDALKAKVVKDGFVTVHDCACGAGALLVAAANRMRSIGVNYQTQALFVGQDIDYTVGLMCHIQLSLLGCAGYVHIGDTLREPLTGPVLFGDGKETTWYTPMFFHDAWHVRREIQRVRQLFRQTETGTQETETPEAPETETPKAEAPETEAQETETREAAEEAEQQPIIFSVSDQDGQIMFGI